MSSNAFQLIAAPFTPMQADRSVALDRIPAYYDFLLSQGVDGAFVCGTTGEGQLLTVEEREAVVSAWTKARGDNGAFRIMVHAGQESSRTASRLARHASSAGVDAIAMTSSTFFKPVNETMAVEQSAEVAAAAPTMPFYYYHIPAMTGLNFSMVKLLTLARQQIPTFAGIKFTHGDAGEYLDCLNLAEGLEIMFGRDEQLLSGLVMGARSAVGSTYNFTTPVYRRMIAAFDRGDLDEARREQTHAREMINGIIALGGLAAMKPMFALAGFDCGPSRLPAPAMSTSAQEKLQTVWQNWQRG